MAVQFGFRSFNFRQLKEHGTVKVVNFNKDIYLRLGYAQMQEVLSHDKLEIPKLPTA